MVLRLLQAIRHYAARMVRDNPSFFWSLLAMGGSFTCSGGSCCLFRVGVTLITLDDVTREPVQTSARNFACSLLWLRLAHGKRQDPPGRGGVWNRRKRYQGVTQLGAAPARRDAPLRDKHQPEADEDVW